MKADVVIIGGGPGGAASAIFLTEAGLNPVIIEKETFPRYHVGESMTGECGAVVRALKLEQQMLDSKFPIKKGLTVYGTNAKNSWFVPVMGRDENWELFRQFTWQVRRSEFDKMILEEAVTRGATLLQGQATEPLLNDDGAVCGVRVRMADGGMQNIESEMVLDCSGQGTFLANAGVTGPKYRGNYDRQIAIYSQVAGAIRDEGDKKDDTLIFYRQKFNWSWFIPLDEEVVSVGIVIPSAYFVDKKESKRDFLVRELHEMNPELTRRIPEVKLVEDVHSVVNYSYQVRQFAGPGYICIGDAHRFIDPIFSFGLYATMKEAQMASCAVVEYLNGVNRDSADPFAEYQRTCERGIDIFEDLIDTFWEQPLAFAAFMHVRYFDQLIDALSGRVYERQPSQAITSMRKLLKRERSYEEDEALPIGSRFHPERADIWNA